MLALAVPALLVLLLPQVQATATTLPSTVPTLGNFPDINSSVVPDVVMDSYCQSLLLSPVPMPPDQIPWYCICSHCQGSQGPKGDRGDRGLPGIPGSPGLRGPQGPNGPPGFIGQPGIKGQKGDNGDQGPAGLQGQQGPKGDQGYKGDKGVAGVQGPPGGQGPRGNDGVCPDPCDATQGPPGPPGLPGPVGQRGVNGADGPKGQKGAKGDMGVSGVPGSNGATGVKGDQGPKGDCSCKNGTDGAPGSKGDIGIKGSQGDQGPKGDQGLPGNKGDMGMMGLPGLPGPCMPQIQSAFSAGLTSSFPTPVMPVIFSQVFYNINNNFLSTIGIYVAPVNGTYVFSFHLTVNNRVLKVGLFHNFDAVLKVTDTQSMGTCSQTIVLHLSEGDGVWLMVKDTSSNGMYTGPESASIFSGYLLYPDQCEVALDLSGIGRDFEGNMPSPATTSSPPYNGPYTW